MTKRYALIAASMLAIASAAHAQYPSIPANVQAEARQREQARNAHLEETWRAAQPIIEEWAKKGKPYIPSASKPSDLPQAGIPSFPGAEGGGMFSFGGRGGKVFVVTTLEDGGPGSFREALESGGPRIVVFNVSGIIRLKSRLVVRPPYLTIDGSSAPGDGVCIAGDTVELEGHDIVIRHMRFRRGETWVGDRNDSIGGNPVGNIMIDHVSASWGLDEDMSMYRHMYQPPTGGPEQKLPTVNITIQNSIFSEALNTYNHAFGSTIGGFNSTFHHNLWASNGGRNPSVGMIGDFGFFNNVVFNWVNRTMDGGDQQSYYNVVNNYYKPGPATPKNEPVGHRILKPEARRAKPPVDDYGHAYVGGNIVEGYPEVTKDNWAGGVQLEPQHPENLAALLDGIRVKEPFNHSPVTIVPAQQAYDYVLATAGATLPKRDPVDTRVIETVRTGKVHVDVPPNLVDQLRELGCPASLLQAVASHAPLGIITDPSQVGGYPEYKGQPYVDTDKDGMPDAWETKYGLNPKDPSDATGDVNGDGYTNIEKFLFGLDPTKKIDWKELKNNVDQRISVKLVAG